MDYDYYLIINIIGDRGVGKTQIVNRYVYDTFDHEHHVTCADHEIEGKVIYSYMLK